MSRMDIPASEARSSVYRLLASLFARELSEENIHGFLRGNAGQLLNALETVPECDAIIRHLKTFFSNITDTEQAGLDLAESYAWNFHGAGGPHSTPLYASVYLSKSKATHQETEQELRGLLHAQKLTSKISEQEPYDHLSVILEFVAWLDEMEGGVRLRQSAQKLRQEVIEKYLLSWLPVFTSRCSNADRLGFYSGLAKATLTYIETDYMQTELLTRPSGEPSTLSPVVSTLVKQV